MEAHHVVLRYLLHLCIPFVIWLNQAVHVHNMRLIYMRIYTIYIMASKILLVFTAFFSVFYFFFISVYFISSMNTYLPRSLPNANQCRSILSKIMVLIPMPINTNHCRSELRGIDQHRLAIIGTERDFGSMSRFICIDLHQEMTDGVLWTVPCRLYWRSLKTQQGRN